jgi:hypothetical protein
VFVIKPAQREKCNTKRVQIYKNKTINRKKHMAGKRRYTRSTGEKILNPETHR